jgi:Mor family transcriptional regulator
LASIDLYSEEAGNQISELANQYDITGDSLNEFINRVNKFDKTFDISTENIVT